MAVPTTDEILAYITKFTGETPDHAWTWMALVDRVRRNFRSTTPAISSRMKPLVEDGRLATVRVSYDGGVFLEGIPAVTVWFTPWQPTTYSPLEHGPVSFKRSADRKNLWANGVKDFFMVREQYDSLLESARAEKARQTQEFRDRKKAEKSKFGAAVREISDDGLELFRSLQKVLPNSDLDGRMMDLLGEEKEYPLVSLRLDQEDFKAFLDVIRAGLVMRGVAESNGVDSTGRTE